MQYYAAHMVQQVIHRLDIDILLYNIWNSTDTSQLEPLGRMPTGLDMFLSTHYNYDRCTVHIELNIILHIYCHNNYNTTISTGSRISIMERSGISNFNGGAGSWTAPGPAGSALDQLIQGHWKWGNFAIQNWKVPWRPPLGSSEDCSDTVWHVWASRITNYMVEKGWDTDIPT